MEEMAESILTILVGELGENLGEYIYDKITGEGDVVDMEAVPAESIDLTPLSKVPIKQIQKIGNKSYKSGITDSPILNKKIMDDFPIERSSDIFTRGAIPHIPSISVVKLSSSLPKQQNPNPAFGQIFFNPPENKRIESFNKQPPSPWSKTSFNTIKSYS